MIPHFAILVEEQPEIGDYIYNFTTEKVCKVVSAEEWKGGGGYCSLGAVRTYNHPKLVFIDQRQK